MTQAAAAHSIYPQTYSPTGSDGCTIQPSGGSDSKFPVADSSVIFSFSLLSDRTSQLPRRACFRKLSERFSQDRCMPLFEFQCEACDSQVELLVSRTEKPACPKCGSRRMEKLMSASVGRVSSGSLPMNSACPPPEAGPCSPHCCRIPQ